MLPSAAGLLAIAAPILFILLSPLQSRAQGQQQGQAQPQAQSQNLGPASTPVYEYEVASIKPSAPFGIGKGSGFRFGVNYTPDGMIIANFPLRALIQMALGVQDYQISGGPDWVKSDRYDVDAKMDSSVADVLQKLSPEDRNHARQLMLQALLADRFKLTFHSDTKELPNFSLVIVKNGPKLQETKPVDPSKPVAKDANGKPLPPGAVRMLSGNDGTRHITAPGATLAAFVSMLGNQLGRPVLDKTGLTAKYDISLQWTSDDRPGQAVPGASPDGMSAPLPADPSGPSIFTAIQEQLGLKLESGKGPVEIIVIDHAEKPSGN
ncbi:MAG: TIGR03435 family protein [Candidatus Acidiferrales bacterium]